MIYVIVGRRIRALREQKNLSQAQLAEATGVSRTSITQMEAGLQRATLETLYQLAKVFKVEIGAMLPEVTVINRAEKVVAVPSTIRLTHSRKRGKVSRRRLR